MTPIRPHRIAAVLSALALLLPVATAHAATDPFTVGGTTGSGALAAFAATTAAATLSSGQTQASVAADFLSQTIQPAASPAEPVSPFAEDAAVSIYVQSASALRNPLAANLRSSSDLALWNLVAAIQAQQVGSPFDLVDTGVTAFQLSALDTDISAVPLPASAWLFVMGLLGLAGTRLTGKTSARAAASDGELREQSARLASQLFGAGPAPARALS